MEIPSRIWNDLVQHENRDLDPESYKSSAGYLFSPYDGVRSIAEIVLGGLLDPERLARMDSIYHFDNSSPSAREVISSLVKGVFVPQTTKPEELKFNALAYVVQNQLADQLMILSMDENATPEVRSEAWVGVSEVASAARSVVGNVNLAARVELFMRDPKQNVPKLKSSGAPAGPPI
jgi:hypothetical protein